MSESPVAVEFLHPSVEARKGSPLGETRLTDKGRLAVIFQAAALLSHLEVAGWRLVSTWQELMLDDHGLLRGVRVEPGPDPERAQHKLIRLTGVLFGVRDRIVGKGQAKRLASQTLQRWHRHQGKLPADRIVTHLLDQTSFLWQPMFAAGRRALIAELTWPQGGRLVVAGRGSFERRLLAEGCDRHGLEDLVAHQDARTLWLSCASGGLHVPPVEPAFDRGRRFYLLGRWKDSLDALVGLQEPAARVLQANCLHRLGKGASARRLLDSESQDRTLSPAESVERIEVRVSLHLEGGEPQLAMSLLAQHQLGAPRRTRLRLDLLAAEVAAKSGDWQAVGRRLSSIEELDEDHDWSWKWNRLMSRWAHARCDLRQAESLAAQALARGRRLLPKPDVADLWQRLATIRLERGDLWGAEKAAGHALRLLECGGEATAMAVAGWLADLRVRQGRLQGVEALLRSAESRAESSKTMGEVGNEELRARMDLVSGRPSAALERLESALERGDVLSAERCQRMRILEARALGWLGRGAEARERLDQVPDLERGHLEPEELPALWALAGDWSRAREAAADDPVGRLWRSGLAGDSISQDDWEVLSSLGTYRAARLVFDFQVLIPGKVPEHWRKKAVQTLRGVSAHSFAERLDRTREGSWLALETYLQGTTQRAADFGDLFARAGYFDVRLEWRHRDVAQVLVSGKGGPLELQAEKRGGRLVLATRSMDPVVSALFALAVREFEPEAESPTRGRSRVRGILGESRDLHEALHRLDRLAGSDVPVLILGETGTGKELAARQLHHLSARTADPLVTVNCAALSDTLLLSDLFGHVRGAFTGADRDRAGVFESARGGTVLLDEIGDLPPAAQGKLLRVLQEGEVRRVGESLPRHIDIRVVAATHRDLHSMVEERTFRADLFYRLKVGCLTLPPLRNRERDVLLLADHFTGSAGHVLTPRARRRLLEYSWPGNVRELRNVLQVAMALSEGTIIDLPDLELPEVGSQPMLGYHQQVEEFRRDLVREALAASDGHRSAAARKLEVSRQALSYLVRRFGL